MRKAQSSLDILDTLTQHELETLRDRFKLPRENIERPADMPPSGSDDESGSGGVPAPAKPPV